MLCLFQRRFASILTCDGCANVSVAPTPDVLGMETVSVYEYLSTIGGLSDAQITGNTSGNYTSLLESLLHWHFNRTCEVEILDRYKLCCASGTATLHEQLVDAVSLPRYLLVSLKRTVEGTDRKICHRFEVPAASLGLLALTFRAQDGSAVISTWRLLANAVR